MSVGMLACMLHGLSHPPPVAWIHCKLLRICRKANRVHVHDTQPVWCAHKHMPTMPMHLLELAIEISLTSLGSSQTFLAPTCMHAQESAAQTSMQACP
jgi:hypothetical protein